MKDSVSSKKWLSSCRHRNPRCRRQTLSFLETLQQPEVKSARHTYIFWRNAGVQEYVVTGFMLFIQPLNYPYSFPLGCFPPGVARATHLPPSDPLILQPFPLTPNNCVFLHPPQPPAGHFQPQHPPTEIFTVPLDTSMLPQSGQL